MIRSMELAPRRLARTLFAAVLLAALPSLAPAQTAAEWAAQVRIVRDDWGVPHIYGETDAATVFGVGYAQAEDYFWQIEDTLLQGLGRYAEVVGSRGLNTDLISRNFEIGTSCRRDYPNLEPKSREILSAFAEGINWYLEKHPEVQPRLLKRIEPWMAMSFGRFTMIDWLGSRVNIDTGDHAKFAEAIREERGSNLWALAPSRTKDGNAMLYVNPHQPWFGVGQWWECHVVSDEGWNFTGATFFAGPFPSIGHNEYLGWTHTANKPDVGDLYKVVFDDPANPLNYKWDGGYRTAEERTEKILVRKLDGTFEEREYTFRKTHHGPIVQKIDDTTYVACRIARLYDGDALAQRLRMTKAKNLDEFLAAVNERCFQMFNIGYADRDGNILYMYYGAIPERDASIKDWHAPVDGTTSATEWKELHSIHELPMTLNPASGYVQNCNQSPWTTCDDGGPYVGDYPPYMVLESAYDNRRAEMSRFILREARDVTFERWKEMVVDTRMHWGITEIPKYVARLGELGKTHPELAAEVEPYLSFLAKWDGTVTVDSAEANLAEAWYGKMYGGVFPSETINAELAADWPGRYVALVEAAEELVDIYGTWKIGYGETHRMQRLPNVADFRTIPFKDRNPSVPVLAGNGSMGTIYNAYFTPANKMRTRRYGVVGGSFMAVYEFGKDRVKAETLLQFGNSGDPESPHFFDQAEKLYTNRKFKPGHFYRDEVDAHAVRTYRPGEEGAGAALGSGAGE